jgi:hypothetical protein
MDTQNTNTSETTETPPGEPQERPNTNKEEELFKIIKECNWAFSAVEKKETELHPFYKQKGFDTAYTCSEIDYTAELSVIDETYNKEKVYIESTTDYYLSCSTEKRIQAIRELKKCRLNIRELENERPVLQKKYQDLLVQKVNLQTNINKKWEEIANQKKDLLGKWFTEADTQIKKLFQINKDVLDQKQLSAKTIYDQHKGQNDKAVKLLTDTQALYQDQLKNVQADINTLNKEGVNKHSWKTMLTTGSALCIAAGWIFSVFTLKTNFASTDVFFYLFKGFQKVARLQPGNGYRVTFQWLGVLGIITLVSLICRTLIVHIKKRQGHNNTAVESEEMQLRLQVDSESIKYFGRIRSGNWTMFWLKIVPLLLVLGTLTILLSMSKDYLQNADELSATVGGFIMGLAIASSMVTAFYIYMIKVIEPRYARLRDNGHRKRFYHNIELYILIILSIGSFAGIMAVIYTDQFGLPVDPAKGYLSQLHPLSAKSQSYISILLYIAVSILGTLGCAYGLRYRALDSISFLLEDKILSYGTDIDKYSGPYRASQNRAINNDIDNLLRSLAYQIKRRNDTIFNDSNKSYYSGISIHKKAEDTNEDSIINGAVRAKEYIKGVINYIWSRIIRLGEWIINNLILPSEKPEEKKASRSHTIHYENRQEQWEKEFFADLYTMIENYRGQIQEINVSLHEVNTSLSALNDRTIPPLSLIYKTIDGLTQKLHECAQNKLEVNNARAHGLTKLKEKYELARLQFKSGYSIGKWYKEQSDTNPPAALKQ